MAEVKQLTFIVDNVVADFERARHVVRDHNRSDAELARAVAE